MPTTPTVVQNATFGTLATQGGPRINIDYRTQLVKQRESAAPFLNLMLNINSERTETYDFRAFETRPNPEKATISGNVAAGGGAGTGVTVNVSAGQGKLFSVRDVVIAKSSAAGAGESVVGVITSITTDALTVRPNDPTKIISAMSDGDELQIWGKSFAQASLSANPSSTVPTLRTFYTQIFKDSYQVSKTHVNNRLYGSPERDRLRAEQEIKHLIGIEKALINGEGVLDTTEDAANPRSTMTGLMRQISSNVLSYGASLSDTELFGFMTDLHAPRYAPDGKMSRRMVLASADLLEQINSIAMQKNQNMGVATVFGMDVSKLVWAGRTWDIVEDPILSDLLPGYGIVFHPRYVKLREFRPTRLEANIQANDADYEKDQFLTELGLEVLLEELHGIIRP
jgi:hypothetical protein